MSAQSAIRPRRSLLRPASCILASATVALAAVLAPWSTIGAALGYGVSYALNTAAMHEKVVVWMGLTALLSFACLCYRRILRPATPLWIVPIGVCLAMLLSFHLYVNSTANLASIVVEDPSIMVEGNQLDYQSSRAASKWKFVGNERNGDRWIQTAMGYASCVAFLEMLAPASSSQSQSTLHLFVNGQRMGISPPQALCARPVDNLIEQQVSTFSGDRMVSLRSNPRDWEVAPVAPSDPLARCRHAPRRGSATRCG